MTPFEHSARSYRLKASASLQRLPALEDKAREAYTVEHREALARENQFFRRMIQEAETCEALARLAAQARALRSRGLNHYGQPSA
jgi:hypothetical protein